MPAGLRVLVLESEPGAADTAIEELRTAGHSVVRCHEPGAPAFPCNGLVERRQCPMESAPVDLALTVRSGAPMHPTPTEDGVSCALRHRVPLVVRGRCRLRSVRRPATTVVGGVNRVVDACERTARLPLSEHSALARRVLAKVLHRMGVAGEGRATVHRRAGGLIVFAHDAGNNSACLRRPGLRTGARRAPRVRSRRRVDRHRERRRIRISLNRRCDGARTDRAGRSGSGGARSRIRRAGVARSASSVGGMSETAPHTSQTRCWWVCARWKNVAPWPRWIFSTIPHSWSASSVRYTVDGAIDGCATCNRFAMSSTVRCSSVAASSSMTARRGVVMRSPGRRGSSRAGAWRRRGQS